MLKVLFHSLTGGFKIPILVISIILMNLYGCKSTQLSKIQGQEANMIFPYPCDSTEVTLQHSHRNPFYRSTDGSLLSLPDDQVHRFQVQNRIENGNCSLYLTISNVMRSDEGTYLSTIYKEGLLFDNYTTRIGLQIDIPPGKASCVVSIEKGGDWVSIDCTANVGSLSGKIECYQNGLWMPSLTDPSETDTLLKQTILIRKSQPAFCCSSTLNEYKERSECNDTALYLAGNYSRDPSPLTSTATIITLNDITETTETRSNTVSYTTKSTKENNLTSVLIYSVLVFIIVIQLLLIFYCFKQRKKLRTYIDNQETRYRSVLIERDEQVSQEGKTRSLPKNTSFVRMVSI